MDIPEEVADRIRERVEAVTKEEVDRWIADNVGQISENAEFRKTVRDYIEWYLPTEIGNRLRCGAYDQGLVKKVFEEQFDAQMERAIKDRLHTYCVRKFETVMLEFLDQMKKQVHNTMLSMEFPKDGD